MENIAVHTKDIVKNFSGKHAVDGVTLSVKEGEIFGILGPNGAGKTTLLRMLATLTSISSGEAQIFGKNVATEASKIRNLIGLTGQYATVDEELTAMENLIIFSRLNGLTSSASKSRSLELLKQFSLLDAKDKAIKNFSGGMRRRLDLAVSLITKPALIFLDEPTTGLDPRTRGEMWDVIRQLVKDGSTILLTTQYLDEADQLADRIAIIDQGKIVSQGTPDELKAHLGETYFEITLGQSNQADKACAIVQKIAKKPATILPEQNKLTVKLQDTKIMTQLLVEFDHQDIPVQEFSVRKPTLDEVFLEITGK
ncbi:MAG TPA: ABC transporter ATP-binding protein [Ruminococcaceae bacterium]|nr:ABC transporter ATP-binding protein [Oscillospiraceae bacterium]